MADNSGITIDQGGRPSQEDIDEENQARASGTAWNDFDAGQRPAEWQADVDKARLTPETLRDATIRPESQSDSMRGMADFLKNRTMAKAGLQDAIQVEFPLMRGQDARQGYSEARTEVSEGSQVPSPQELWNGLESFIKAPEREMNPATLAAWGTWNLANMGVEGGKKMWEAFKGLDEMIYGEGYQPGQEDEAGALAGIKAATAVASLGVGIAKPAGSLSSFSGRVGAKNLAKAGRPQADTALDMAEMLDKKGYSEDKIRDLTRALAEEGDFGGVSKGTDGKWRFEISDHKFEITTPWEKMRTGLYLDDLIKHDDLFLAHPEMKDMTVVINKLRNKSDQPSGAFNEKTNTIHIEARNAEDVKEIVSHEWTHWLQKNNDFARGSNPDIEGVTNYMRSAGENEARSVPLRRDLTSRERAEQHPSMHEVDDEGVQIPRSEQIVRMSEDMIAANEKAVPTKFKDKNYYIIDKQTGEVVGGTNTLNSARRSVDKRDNEYGAYRYRHMKREWYEEAQNTEKSLSKYSIFSQVKEVDKQITAAQKQIDRLQEQIKSERHPPGEIERKRNTLMSKHDRLKALQERKLSLGVEAIQEPKPNLIQATIEEIKQGAPKTGTEDIGSMPQRRSKLERLTERVESLTTVIELETRIPRKERAQKELTKVLNELKFIGEGK